jgi:hypothetical protein
LKQETSRSPASSVRREGTVPKRSAMLHTPAQTSPARIVLRHQLGQGYLL